MKTMKMIVIVMMFGFLVQPTCAEVLDEVLSEPNQSQSTNSSDHDSPNQTTGEEEVTGWKGKIIQFKEGTTEKWNDFRASKKALESKEKEIERLRYELESLQDKFVIYQNGGRAFTDHMDAVCAFYRNGGLRDSLRGDNE